MSGDRDRSCAVESFQMVNSKWEGLSLLFITISLTTHPAQTLAYNGCIIFIGGRGKQVNRRLSGKRELDREPDQGAEEELEEPWSEWVNKSILINSEEKCQTL